MSEAPLSNDVTAAVMAKADALMSRHRVFIAGATSSREHAESNVVQEAEDDFPVLEEIVEVAATSLSTKAEEAERAEAERQAQIRAEVEKWLDEVLPDEVLRVMDGISDQLIATLANQLRSELLPRLLAAARHLPEESQAFDTPRL